MADLAAIAPSPAAEPPSDGGVGGYGNTNKEGIPGHRHGAAEPPVFASLYLSLRDTDVAHRLRCRDWAQFAGALRAVWRDPIAAKGGTAKLVPADMDPAWSDAAARRGREMARPGAAAMAAHGGGSQDDHGGGAPLSRPGSVHPAGARHPRHRRPGRPIRRLRRAVRGAAAARRHGSDPDALRRGRARRPCRGPVAASDVLASAFASLGARVRCCASGPRSRFSGPAAGAGDDRLAPAVRAHPAARRVALPRLRGAQAAPESRAQASAGGAADRSGAGRGPLPRPVLPRRGPGGGLRRGARRGLAVRRRRGPRAWAWSRCCREDWRSRATRSTTSSSRRRTGRSGGCGSSRPTSSRTWPPRRPWPWPWPRGAGWTCGSRPTAGRTRRS